MTEPIEDKLLSYSDAVNLLDNLNADKIYRKSWDEGRWYVRKIIDKTSEKYQFQPFCIEYYVEGVFRWADKWNPSLEDIGAHNWIAGND